MRKFMPAYEDHYEQNFNSRFFDIIYRISIDKLKEVWYTESGQMEYCPNIFQADRSVRLIKKEWDEYGIRTEPP